jgi:hypothetical protein
VPERSPSSAAAGRAWRSGCGGETEAWTAVSGSRPRERAAAAARRSAARRPQRRSILEGSLAWGAAHEERRNAGRSRAGQRGRREASAGAWTPGGEKGKGNGPFLAGCGRKRLRAKPSWASKPARNSVQASNLTCSTYGPLLAALSVAAKNGHTRPNWSLAMYSLRIVRSRLRERKSLWTQSPVLDATTPGSHARRPSARIPRVSSVLAEILKTAAASAPCKKTKLRWRKNCGCPALERGSSGLGTRRLGQPSYDSLL